MSALRPFHLAIPVRDLDASREFYTGVLGCAAGRSSARWIDFDFFGHQLTAHLAKDSPPATNEVDGKQVPVRHFGIILAWDQWQELAERLDGMQVDWLIGPGVRFAGQPGEQATFFITDPSGNALEFKAFRNDTAIFASGSA